MIDSSHGGEPASPWGALSLSLVVIGCGVALGACADPGSTSASLIHGDDDRQEVFAATGDTEAIQATAALMLDTQIAEDGTLTQTMTHGELWQLCGGERFAEQPINAACSATMIGEDLMLTTFHCMPSNAACNTTRAVFDYLYVAEGTLADIGAEDVYPCMTVLASDETADYAVFQVARPIEGRRAVTVALNEPNDCLLDDDQPLVTYGFPAGVPMKVDDGAVVTSRATASRRQFRASFDSFAIHNGGGVYNTDGELVGMLLEGGPDYAPSANDASCYVPVVATGDSVQSALYANQAVFRFCQNEGDTSASLSERQYPNLCPIAVDGCDATGALDGTSVPFPPGSGCGCRVGPTRTRAPLVFLVGLLLAVGFRRFRL